MYFHGGKSLHSFLYTTERPFECDLCFPCKHNMELLTMTTHTHFTYGVQTHRNWMVVVVVGHSKYVIFTTGINWRGREQLPIIAVTMELCTIESITIPVKVYRAAISTRTRRVSNRISCTNDQCWRVSISTCSPNPYVDICIAIACKFGSGHVDIPVAVDIVVFKYSRNMNKRTNECYVFEMILHIDWSICNANAFDLMRCIGFFLVFFLLRFCLVDWELDKCFM